MTPNDEAHSQADRQTPMTDTDDLRKAVLMLIERTTDLRLHVETLRALLYAHGVVSDAEFEALLRTRQQAYEAGLAERLKGTSEEFRLEALRRLLEAHDNKPQ